MSIEAMMNMETILSVMNRETIMRMETIGWIGSALFAICGLPQAIECYKAGHARGLNWFFLGAWFGGEVLTIIYVWPKADYPLLANYFMNLVFLVIMLKFKIWERKSVNAQINPQTV